MLFCLSAASYQCRTVTHCLLRVTLLLQKAFATCFYISDSLHFECRFAPTKCVRYLAPLITHVFLYVSSFLQKLFVNWLLHKRFAVFCASLCSFKRRSLLSAAHYSRIFVRLFVPSKIVRKLASACYSLSLCVAFAPSNRFARYPGFPARIESLLHK